MKRNRKWLVSIRLKSGTLYHCETVAPEEAVSRWCQQILGVLPLFVRVRFLDSSGNTVTVRRSEIAAVDYKAVP